MLALAACGGHRPAKASSCGAARRAAAGIRAAGPIPHFSHVVVIAFENEEYGNVIGDRQAPTFNRLARPAPLTHYSLLRTIEDAWGLPRLGRSASAPPIVGIWRRRPARSPL